MLRKLKIPAKELKKKPVKISIPPVNDCDQNAQESISNDENNFLDIDSNDSLRLRSGYSMNASVKQQSAQRNMVKLVETAKVADRYHISNVAVAALSSAILMDYKVIDAENTQHIVDQSKVRRNRNAVRMEATKMQEANRTPLLGLYFDGRKDQTKVYKNKKIVMEKQEHISLVQQPGSIYIGHITVEEGDSRTVSEELVGYFDKKSISLANVKVMSCDGCPVNTGHENGIVVRLERMLQEPMQWIICLLHLNELPLRNLIKEHDGKTTGPNTFIGTIGKNLENCEKKQIVEFEQIEFPYSGDREDISKSLNWEQGYLFEICDAIANGECPRELGNKLPGKLSHSRWVTTANRLCRLYVSTPNPSKLLVTLVKYVMWVYAPTHFNIKQRPSVVFGAIHLANIIKASRFLDRPYLRTVHATISRNGFFAHHENLLLAILNDESEQVRYRGWRKILEIRNINNNNNQNLGIREFKIPQINFDAENYTEIMDWENLANTLPPILRPFQFFSDDPKILAERKISEYELDFDILSMPCHTQSVERCVKIVTEASMEVCGEDRRDGYILNTLQSRQKMPIFRTKSDFTSNVQNNMKNKLVSV